MNLNLSTGINPESSIIEMGSRTPALQHFFPCNEIGGTRLTDVAGGCIWDLAGSGFSLGFNASLKSVNCNMLITTPPINFRSGAFKSYDVSKHHLFIVACRPSATARVAFGDNNALLYPSNQTAGWGMAELHTVVGTGSGTVWGESLTGSVGGIFSNCAGQDVVVYAYHVPGASMIYKFIRLSDNASLWTEGSPVEDVASSSTFNINFNPCMRFAGLDLYGIALYQFSAQPSDLALGILTMGNNWKNGIRTSYAPWIGRS
jgi:hypothetical protein